MITVTVNGRRRTLDIEPDAPLLWVIREELGLTGAKFGCGIGQCGACTVHIEGTAQRSCQVPVRAVDGKQVTTIEGLSPDSRHPVQIAWAAEDVPQCGYCQSGQIMAAAAFLKTHPDPTDADIDAGLTNLCRCGTYPRIRKAVHRAAALAAGWEA
jgi:isoquinoline 1-oxidoreductase alpha subunit